MLKSNERLLLLLIISLAFFLRVYKIETNFNFTGEFGANLLDIKNAVEGHYIPLVGPTTSHPWLYFGPFYYWLGIVIIRIWGGNPLNFALIGVITGTSIVFLNYLIIKKIFKSRVALLSSFFIAISPLFILFSREARFFFLVVPLFYPLIWSLFKIWRGDKKYFFWSGLSYGAMFSFHCSPIVLAPFIALVLWLQRTIVKFRDVALFLVGLLIPNIPLLIFDSRQNFQMLGSLAIWIPYRISGFLGFYRNENFSVINQFFGEMFAEKKEFWLPISIILISFLIYKYLRLFRGKKISFGWLTILSMSAFGLSAFFVHGEAPIHYLLPIFPITPILAAILISYSWKYRTARYLIIAIVSLFAYTNAVSFLSSSKFYGEPTLSVDPHFVPYDKQLKVARYIISDTDGRNYTLYREGPFDYFDQNYSQNYKYLLWWFGNEPVERSELRYKIIEKENEVAIAKEELR